MYWRQLGGWIRWLFFSLLLSHGVIAPAAAPLALSVASRPAERNILITDGERTWERRGYVRCLVDDLERSPLNLALFRTINDNHHPAPDRFFLWFRYLGSGLVLAPLLLLVYFWRRRLCKPLLIALAVETLVVLAIKYIVYYPRPILALGPEQVRTLLDHQWHSFPSGDAAMAFVIAGVISWRAHWLLRGLLLLYAGLIAYGRVYLGVHFPLDIAAGTLIGVLSAGVALWIVKRQSPSDREGDDALPVHDKSTLPPVATASLPHGM